MTSAPTASYRGRHEVARRSDRLPTLPRRRAPSRWPARVLILLSAALAYAGARRAGPLATPPPDPAESSLIGEAASLVRDGLSSFVPAADTAAAVQVAAWSTARDGLAGARELMVVAAVATVLLTGALVRRIGLSLPATVVATVVTAALPWAVAAHRLALPVNLAVPWLLAAAWFASPNARRRVAMAPAALCLLVAVLTAPLIVPIAVLTIAVLLADRDVGAGWTTSNRVAGVAVLGVLAAGCFATVAGLGGDGFGLGQPAPDVAPVLLDLIVGGLVVVGAAAGTIVRWLRSFALVVLGCAVVAAVAGQTRTPLLLLALPAAAVVLGAAIDAARSAVRTRRS